MKTEDFMWHYWLRPLTGLTRSLEAKFFDLARFAGKATMSDVGCGDGIFSSLAVGGSVDSELDPYINIAPSHESAVVDAQGRVDVFLPGTNHEHLGPKFDWGAHKELNQDAGGPWTLGIDHKSDLLNRASTTGSFSRLRLANLDGPSDLFEQDEVFDVVFSNALYWAGDPSAVLREIGNHQVSGAHLSLCLALPQYSEGLIANTLPHRELAKVLDRGRSTHVSVLWDRSRWLNEIEAAGYEVVRSQFHIGRELASASEWLDLREFYPYIARLEKGLPKGFAKEVRRDWVNHLMQLVAAADQDGLLDPPDSGAYLLVEASKR